MRFILIIIRVTFLHIILTNANEKYNLNDVENDCQCVPKEMCLDNDTKINGEDNLDIR